MRALAGPAMLLAIVGGFALHRAFSEPEAPPRSFLDLELAAPQTAEGHRGTCFSLSTVIIANTRLRSLTVDWRPAHDDAWRLALEEIVQGERGPVHVYQRYTFQQRDELVELVDAEVSEGIDPDLTANLDALLEAPNERATPVDRCLEPGAVGYKFKARR
jgi:hypothetical protein